MSAYTYTEKDFFQYQFYIDRDYFGFENLVNSINMLAQVAENNLLLVGHHFDRSKTFVYYDNEIPGYPITTLIDIDTYNMWKGWYNLKERDIKEL